MTAIIDVESLTKSYGSKRGITDVSFQVEEGEVFGFLGPNGAGKTTTIRLLMALLRADAGSSAHCRAGLLAAIRGDQAADRLCARRTVAWTPT